MTAGSPFLYSDTFDPSNGVCLPVSLVAHIQVTSQVQKLVSRAHNCMPAGLLSAAYQVTRVAEVPDSAHDCYCDATKLHYGLK